ncbi:MAG: bifunctional riboflavin kinase/FAD synthetase [Gemmatimonadetes bacterium]|uniref:Riboflavin biosynthesis protein n=1 Tax=Candidatus Kutchimonas denitrificans TaxID=3056748 RepID=A0AAE4ZDC0_9BACT|nr:bifunctional riboflavin kinase/FAD synthetase [Gemmatimonadota bacterium]NIR76210.1 bifunctional riboflavin kinase/FAD synthetase [Candidatus Kutchimonas denitrificans]NIS00650.1 bifunctional riboflavin kinase/FAD synthetase [Gemmatimonadota bacterium]NIT66795.1 bifunctional riboflavin kinase/FAD synthetase [Gemmatimonadota bacterium]NIV23394.1 bifunctional riboflavin kinase/FAD synthetase [Gemmatimonadota bacterium]
MSHNSYDLHGLPLQDRGAAITVGTFDGLHRGHWSVLQQLEDSARRDGLLSVLVTFDPHPLKIVRPDAAPGLLTTPNEKKEILTLSGLDYAVFLSFTRSLSLYLPEEFVRDVLLARFGLRKLVVGYDHGFGRDRSGDVDTMREIGTRHGFGVEVVRPVLQNDDAISSSGIRRALTEGDVEKAARGLGRPYSLTGVVVHGEGRGRTLGFATANVAVHGTDKLLPLEGIYAVRAATRSHLGVGLLHLGPRPTFRGSPPSIELHLLEFEGDLYGEQVRVEFLTRLRDVQPFGSAAELVEQMKRDRAKAVRYFEDLGGRLYREAESE